MKYFALLLNGDSLPHSHTNLSSVLDIVFSVAGALAVLMLIIGGLRYVLSGGDTNKVAEAKRQITYSIVGVVVILLAAVIVNFVLDRA